MPRLNILKTERISVYIFRGVAGHIIGILFWFWLVGLAYKPICAEWE